MGRGSPRRGSRKRHVGRGSPRRGSREKNVFFSIYTTLTPHVPTYSTNPVFIVRAQVLAGSSQFLVSGCLVGEGPFETGLWYKHTHI